VCHDRRMSYRRRATVRRDEGGPFGFGDQEPISRHRKLLRAKAVVVSDAETPRGDFGSRGRERRAHTNAASGATGPSQIVSDFAGLSAGASWIRTSSPTVVFAVARAGRERISISAADSTCLLEGDYRFEPAFPQRAVGGSSFAPRPQRENSAHLRKWDLQFEFRVLQCRVSVSREFAFLMSRSRAFPAGVCGPGCLADGQKRRRGGRMIVTSRVRESCRGRLVTPLDAAARWNGRGDKGEAA